MSLQNLALSAVGESTVLSFGEVEARVRHFFEHLRTVHPEFRFWERMGKSRYEGLDPQWHDLEVHLRSMARPEKRDRADFSALDEAGDVTGETRSERGYTFMWFTSDAEGGPADGQNHARRDIVEMRMTVGGNTCSISMKFPPSRPDLTAPAVMRQVVDAVLAIWHPTQLDLGSPELREHYLAGAISNSQIRVGWMTYLRHPLLASCLPENLPCEVDIMPDGAMLFVLSPHEPDPASKADTAKARALQQFFDQLHFDNYYMIAGWPQDEADDDYASQVTGAPRGRKYAVAFCAFDGYDAKRSVLLFAKMFSGYVGDIYHPYALENEERRESLVFVVQARHQLAALDYVGASTPIEWHIGIEENARDLTVLFKHAGIPVKRLRVVYTPFVA